MTDSVVLRSFQAGTVGRLAPLLAEDVVFASPVAEYRGRAAASHILGLVARTLERVEPTAEWGADDQTVVAFTATVAGEQAQGMFREERDAAGAPTQVTLFLRPYRTLRIAMDRMRDLLEHDPLPAAHGK